MKGNKEVYDPLNRVCKEQADYYGQTLEQRSLQSELMAELQEVIEQENAATGTS